MNIAHCLAIVSVLASSLVCRAGETNAPSTNAPTAVVQIDINIGRGAFRTFYADGRVHGQHVSHPQNPVVHLATNILSEAELRGVWDAAEALPKQLRGKNVEPKSEWKSWVELRVVYSDDRDTHLSWPAGEEYPDQKVQALVKLLLQNHTGAW